DVKRFCFFLRSIEGQAAGYRQNSQAKMPALPLAAGTIVRAPGGLDDSPNRGAATGARLPFPIVNQQPFLVKIRRLGRTAKIKKPAPIAQAGVIQGTRAAKPDGFGEGLANGRTQARDLPKLQVPRPCPRRNAGAK